MIAGALYFDSWDKLDEDWDTGTSSDKSDSGWGVAPRDSAPPAGSDESGWGTRGKSPGGGGRPLPPVESHEDTTDVYTIRAVSEIPYRGMTGFSKIISGKPLLANNQYNISLQRSGSLGHGGGAISGVIYGKIENQAINPGMRVRIKGRNKRGLVVIDRMYDVDSNDMEIYINHFWRDPLDRGGRMRPGGGILPVFLFFAVVLAVVIAGVYAFGGGLDPALVSKIKMIAAIIAILFFIKVFNINFFNNSFVQKILLFVILVAIALYVPGGDSVMVAAIMLYGLYIMIKGIIR